MRERVALVNMPFFGTNRPSLGLSLLKSALRARGVESEVIYLNLDYAALIGASSYGVVEGSTSSLLVGEWIFAESLWGPNPGRDDRYLRLLLGGVDAGKYIVQDEYSAGEIADVVRKARACAGDFVEYCLDRVAWDEFKIVGFSSTFQQQVASLALAKRLKARYPHLYCVFGGANCEDEMGLALFESFAFIDAVCTGEGDLVFPELAARVLDEGPALELAGMYQRELTSPVPPLVPSSRDRDGIGQGSLIPRAVRVADIDSLPVPDYDDFFSARRAPGIGGDAPLRIPFETSRGCWWGQKHHCTFCGLNGGAMTFREKSSARAVAEITAQGLRYARFTHEFEAVDNILPMSYFHSLLPELARLDRGYRIFYETKANLRPEQVRLLSRAGVTSIQPGIESLSTPVLARMRKGVKTIQNLQLLMACAQHGVRPYWNYLVGFPGEVEGDYAGQADLFRLISHLAPPSSGTVGKVRFDRFSPYTTEPGALGVRGLVPYPAYSLVYEGLDEATVRRLAYYFEGRFDGDEAVPDRLALLNAGVAEWRAVHGGSALFFVEADRALIVFDFRPASRHPHTVLPEPWCTLYRECVSIRGGDALRIRFHELCGSGRSSEGRLEGAIATLVDRRLLWNEEGQYLALALSLDGGYHLPALLALRLEALLPGIPALLADAPCGGLARMPLNVVPCMTNDE